jgi:hypothetical protein
MGGKSPFDLSLREHGGRPKENKLVGRYRQSELSWCFGIAPLAVSMAVNSERIIVAEMVLGFPELIK